MRDLLNKGYTIFISEENGKINGIALKKLDNGNGIITQELDGDRIKVLGELPSLGKKLEDGEKLQIYKSYEETGIRYKAQLGKYTKEGPYCEEDCLRVSAEVEDEEFLGAIILLNEAIKQAEGNDNSPKKLVRRYGEVTYK